MIVPTPYYFPVPPSATDNPMLYAWSMSGFMVVVMISLEWSHRLVWAMVERPESWKSPRAMNRIMWLMIHISILLRNAPDVVQWMLWKETSPYTRYLIAYWNRVGDGLSIWPMVGAWILARFSEPLINFQLGREPILFQMYTTRRQMQRPTLIVILSIVICFAIAFHR